VFYVLVLKCNIDFSEELPCLIDMPDAGFTPKDKVDVQTTVGTDGTTQLSVKSKVPTTYTPGFSSFKLTSGDNIQEVRYTPLGKDGKPTGETRVFTVPADFDRTQPLDVIFNTPMYAEELQIELIPLNKDVPTTADLESLFACLEEGIFNLKVFLLSLFMFLLF